MLPELSDKDRNWYTLKGYEIIINQFGAREWYLNGKRHREDGPAFEHVNGARREWYLNGKRHREDGPAVEFANGIREWYLTGKRHREDGPAAEWANGNRFWYLNGKNMTEEEHRIAINEMMKNVTT